MSADIECPNCKHPQEICHDDGQGYEEDQLHEQCCISCDYEFKFTTYTTFTYTPYCAKPEDHDMEETTIKGFYHCTKCESTELRDEVSK